MVILGIESTAHTFGIGLVNNGKILANIKDTYTTEAGGIIPIEAAKHHAKIAEELYNEALERANVKEAEIKAIAVSNAPGLAPCLLEGLKFAKKLAEKLKVPLVPVNHCIAHLEIGKVTGAKNPVMLYVSGANTQIIAYEAGKYRIFGETLDMGVGNFIDSFARHLDIGFPGGPKIEQLAKNGKYVELPYTVKGMDIALSGILTNLRQKIERINELNINFDPTTIPQTNLRPDLVINNKKLAKVKTLIHPHNLINNKESLTNSRKSLIANYTKEDLCFSMQETVFAMLVEVAERALAHTGKKELLLGGGVACNKRLQEMCKIMCEERGAKLFVPENSLLVDNAAMIGFLGEIMFNARIKQEPEDVDIAPRERTDDVEVRWK